MSLEEEIVSNEIYREHYHHKEVYRNISEVPIEISYLNFWRKKDSHKGIKYLSKISHLTATAVNNQFFEEICELKTLDSLVLSEVDIDDISTLKNLQKLRYLKLVKLKPCKGLDCLINLPSIQKLWINESKEITNYYFLKGAKTLVAVGVEGSTWTNQKIDSLEPFSEMENLEAIFMSSVQLKDKNLNYVSSNKKLRYFTVSRLAPKSSFENLRKIRPDIVSQWFDNYEL